MFLSFSPFAGNEFFAGSWRLGLRHNPDPWTAYPYSTSRQFQSQQLCPYDVSFYDAHIISNIDPSIGLKGDRIWRSDGCLVVYVLVSKSQFGLNTKSSPLIRIVIFEQPRPGPKLPKGEHYFTIGWKQVCGFISHLLYSLPSIFLIDLGCFETVQETAKYLRILALVLPSSRCMFYSSSATWQQRWYVLAFARA